MILQSTVNIHIYIPRVARVCHLHLLRYRVVGCRSVPHLCYIIIRVKIQQRQDVEPTFNYRRLRPNKSATLDQHLVFVVWIII